MVRHLAPLPLALACFVAAPAIAEAPRPLKVDDLFAIKDVDDPRLSPDGRWVAYTVTTLDAKKDDSDTDVYLSPIGGGDAVRLTTSPKAETHPRFSPDGKWIAFLSGREGEKTQVWLMPRSGGEAVKLTDLPSSVSTLAWSPDSQRLALVMKDVDPDAPAKEDAAADKDSEAKTKKPIVTRRLQFKRDYEGYLKEQRRHVYVFDVQKKTSFQLTAGPFDDSSPVWSPDGSLIAFVSNRTLPDSDRSQNTDVFVVAPKPGQVPRAVETSPGEDGQPSWSPDGKWIVYVQGGDPKDMWYGSNHLALAPVDGGPARALTADLDRNVLFPRFSPDGRWVYFLVEEGGVQPLARVSVAGGAVERVTSGERELVRFDVSPAGEIVVLESSPQQPAEISQVAGAGLTRVTHVNDAWRQSVNLGDVRRFKTKSQDGTPIDGFLTLPPGYVEGTKLPAILRIHGGPTSQFVSAFSFEWQYLAAQGYAVIAANPRGSTGYGTPFARAIWADWGGPDSDDVLAAVDQAVGMGIADPDRLGVGGWSYGGILTNYVIHKTGRFKAAVSGASASNILAGYGTDHYQHEYEVELGLPWKTLDVWLHLSSPFLEADKITTPTLFLCGQRDMNVPLLNTEQMYEAVRRVGNADTELVIYPDQWHGIDTPSYQKDRLERYVAWYDRYLKPPSAARPLGVAKDTPPETTSLLGRPLYAVEPAPAARQTLEGDLAKATADFLKDPDGAEAILWLGRRQAYLGHFREAVATYSRGVARYPADARFLRHRGHRYVTLRNFDAAIADLEKAARLLVGKGDQPDTGSDPKTPASTTLKYAIYYHLGLAHYLKGDFAGAEKAYRSCLEAARGNDDAVAGASDWLYMTLRRLGRGEEAAKVLEPIRADMKVTDDAVYLNRLLMYKGVYAPEDLLRAGGDDLTRATYGYAVANWYLLSGRKDDARALFERVVAGPQWAAFGHIASEAELARMR
jgi:dipeptidyl aminopeptidase/acylaminoacyl peptidase/tetratricopeptide (TPR) repeat protein